jgi:acyl-coenzyme A synthetase/AMP-(fatty) acid ligase
VDVLAALAHVDRPALHVEGPDRRPLTFSELAAEVHRRAKALAASAGATGSRSPSAGTRPDRVVWSSEAVPPAEQLIDLLAALQADRPVRAVNRAWWPREQAAVEQLFAEHDGDEHALWLGSSGTTGEPTPYGFTGEQVSAWLAAPWPAIGPADRVVVTGDVGHGPVLRVALAALVAGAELRFAGRGQLAAVLHRERLDVLCTTPILLRRTLRQLERHERTVHGVALTIVHQGDLRAHEAAAWPTVLHGEVRSAVSSTEAGGWVTLPDAAPGVRWSTDPDGTLRLAGSAVARAWLHEPAPPLGWATGDLVDTSASDGTLRLRGRAADHFVVDGVSVDPLAVERALAAHPLVADVAVAPRPDPLRQHIVVAVIVPARPDWPPFPEDLAEVTAALNDAARPAALAIVEDLPTNAAGALSRRLLTYDEATR